MVPFTRGHGKFEKAWHTSAVLTAPFYSIFTASIYAAKHADNYGICRRTRRNCLSYASKVFWKSSSRKKEVHCWRKLKGDVRAIVRLERAKQKWGVERRCFSKFYHHFSQNSWTWIHALIIEGLKIYHAVVLCGRMRSTAAPDGTKTRSKMLKKRWPPLKAQR